MARNFWVQIAGVKRGPVAASEVKALALSGDLAEIDLVSVDDGANWTLARNVKGLEFSSKPMPPPVSLPQSPPIAAPTGKATKPSDWIGMGVGLVFVVALIAGAFMLAKQIRSGPEQRLQESESQEMELAETMNRVDDILMEDRVAAEESADLDSTAGSTPERLPENGPECTLDEYYRLKDDMTLVQVIAIIGSAGKEITRFESKGVSGFSKPTEHFTYHWENADGSVASATFVDGKLHSKHHFGLK